ncbi:MAG: BamA/TamA family outer membrane protein [Myxococcota bacterium]|nr:BamA/TamA family outer membrane protein [Myxococcota bacterium]
MSLLAALLIASPSLELVAQPRLPLAQMRSLSRYAQSAGLEGENREVINRLQQQLRELDRFLMPRCTVIKEKYRCILRQSPRVAELLVTGPMPSGLLRSDLERRSSLRAGRRLPVLSYGSDEAPFAELLSKIGRRLGRFIDERGYSGSRVVISLSAHARGAGWRSVTIEVKLGNRLRWGGLEVIGVPLKEAKALRQRVRRLGGAFRSSTLRDRVADEEANLRKMGYIEASIDAQVETRKTLVDVRLQIRRGPRLQVHFQGKLRAPLVKLRKALTFASARSVNNDQINASIESLRDYYQSRGYFRPMIRAEDPQLAALDIQEEELKRKITRVRRRLKGQVKKRRTALAGIASERQELRLVRRQVIAQAREFRRLVFHIDPGKKARCAEVRIAGIPFNLQHDIIGSDLLSTKPPQLGRHDGRLLDGELKADEERIAAYLENQGWLVSHVETQLLLLNPQQIRATFVVSAGPPTYIRSISLVGVSDGESDNWDEEEESTDDLGEDLYGPLIDALQIKAGSPLLENSAETLRKRSLRFYTRRGYPGTRVEVRMALTGDGAQFRLIVKEGQRVTYGGLILSGTFRTRRNLVLAAFSEARVGAPFNPQTFAKAAALLRTWRVFRRVRLRYLGLEEKRQQVFVDVSVEEGISQTLDLTLGYSIEDNFQTSLSWRDRNVFGRAWALETRGVWGLYIGRRSELRSSLKLPRLLGPNTDFSIEPRLYYREPNRPFPTLGEGFFRLQNDHDLILKGVLKVAHRFSQFSTLVANYTYALDRDVNGGQMSIVRTGATAIEGNWLAVDNPFNPKTGVHLKGALKFASPWLAGDANFLSAIAHATVYVPLGDVTLAANLRGGALHELENSYAIAGSDLFRLGGERSLRGFALDSIRLFRAQDNDSRSGRDGHGTRFASSSLELRIPIGLQRANSGIGVTLFSDLGWVAAEDWQEPQANNMGWSNGLAANYVLPIGPVGVVIAHQSIRPQRPSDVAAPDRQEYQLIPVLPNRLGFHISMGYIF